MTNNELAWKIYRALKDKGAGIGNASVPIIQRVLDNELQAEADLLAACETALIQMVALGNQVNWDDIPDSYAIAINDIRAAIAKAKGEDL